MQLKRIMLVSVALILVALVLGVSIGYSISPTTTRTTTLSTTLTETVPTTITVVPPSGAPYTVYTVTQQTALVYIVVPDCSNTSGLASNTITTVPASSTVVFVTQSGANYSGVVSFTTVTNNTLALLVRTQSGIC